MKYLLKVTEQPYLFIYLFLLLCSLPDKST